MAVVVEVKTVRDPKGRLAVLLQVEDEWWLAMRPGDARDLARRLIEHADEVEELAGAEA